MRSITRSFYELGADFNLSPEHWIATQASSNLVAGTRLSEIVDVVSQQQTPPENARFVLDTGNAREGLLDVTVLGNPVSGRTSSKKIVQDGDVIISRLRPYLRQVALIPEGTCELLGVDRLYCSTEFFIFRAKKENSNIAGIVAWLLSEPIQEMVSSAATGGHHPRIGVDLLLNAPVEDCYLDVDFGNEIASLLRRHIEGQRKLNVILRH
ncbi:hypothetical protein [Novosphingobium lindaniclasticum]|uniref:hypothetical protein n=1 Tax=Novosphingobium lindaniclasticum TaxID=1329895 RepID=UPI001267F94C|nr:hypothetical protein [Novosphingobium lindaniclasticum]